MNEKSFDFTIYIIHALANKKNMLPKDIYAKFKKYKCIDDFLVPNYDVLHTLDPNAVIDDVENYLVSRGGAL